MKVRIRFVIGGTEIYKTSSNCIPSVGEKVTISMDAYKKGLYPGLVITFTVNEDFPRTTILVSLMALLFQ